MKPHFIDYPHNVTCTDTEQVRDGMACCYLLRSGNAWAFVECGTSLSVPGLLRVLERKGVSPQQVAYVMPTHVHLDHAGGAGELMRHCPNARLVIHPRGQRHMVDPTKLYEGAAQVYGLENMAKMYGEVVAVPAERVLVAGDGFRLDFSGRELLFLDAPGHAKHHYVIWDAESRGIFSGDVLGISYRDFDGPGGPYLFPTTTPIQFDPVAWSATLDRLEALDPAFIYFTHYGRLGNAHRLFRDLRRGIAAYERLALHHAGDSDRHVRLRDALTAHALHELQAISAPVPEKRARELLQDDMELNTQGLEYWLDHREPAASAA